MEIALGHTYRWHATTEKSTIINDTILDKSLSYFSGYIKCIFTSSYTIECNMDNYYVCENSN